MGAIKDKREAAEHTAERKGSNAWDGSTSERSGVSCRIPVEPEHPDVVSRALRGRLRSSQGSRVPKQEWVLRGTATQLSKSGGRRNAGPASKPRIRSPGGALAGLYGNDPGGSRPHSDYSLKL